MAILADREIKGHIYPTNVKNGPDWLTKQNITSVIAALNDETGEEIIILGSDSFVSPNDLKKLTAALARQAFDLESVTLEGSSHRTVSISALIKEKGGHPRLKMKKPPESFMLGRAPKDIPRKK